MKKITNFYNGLSRIVPPKTEFVTRVSKRCHVGTATVRLWIRGKTKPLLDEHLRILSEETGISKEELFNDYESKPKRTKNK